MICLPGTADFADSAVRRGVHVGLFCSSCNSKLTFCLFPCILFACCYLRPQKDLDCRASITPNSAVVLGPALPRAVPSASQLQRAPLIPAVFPPHLVRGSAVPRTHTMRSKVQAASVPVFGSDTPWTDSSISGVSILWDTGAYGQSTVPQSVFDAFQRYFSAVWAAVNASAPLRDYGLTIRRCPDVGAVCGANILSSALHSCLQVDLPAGNAHGVATVQRAARRALHSLYPPSIDITTGGGSVAKLPTAFTVDLCTRQGFTHSSGAAVCSHIQPPNIPSTQRETQEAAGTSGSQGPGSMGALCSLMQLGRCQGTLSRLGLFCGQTASLTLVAFEFPRAHYCRCWLLKTVSHTVLFCGRIQQLYVV